MILPSDDECRSVIEALSDEPSLTEWEQEFVESNIDRHSFTPAQKESIARMMEKYDVV